VIKVFDKKGPRAGKFSVKYKDDPSWWTHSLLREGYGKDKQERVCCLLVLNSVTYPPQWIRQPMAAWGELGSAWAPEP